MYLHACITFTFLIRDGSAVEIRGSIPHPNCDNVLQLNLLFLSCSFVLMLISIQFSFQYIFFQTYEWLFELISMVEWWFWDWGWLYDTINDLNGWMWIDGCWRSFCGRMKSKRGNGRRGLLDGSGWNSGGGLLKTDGHFSLSFSLFLYICVSVSPILAESENERGCALTRLKWHRSFSLSSVWALGVGAAPPVTSNDHLGRYINSSNEFSIHLNPAPWINPIYLSIGWKVSSFLISFSPPLKAGAGAGRGGAGQWPPFPGITAGNVESISRVSSGWRV